MSNSNNLTTQPQQSRFSVAITTKNYRDSIANTLQDPQRQQRFVAAITSAVAVNAELQNCDPRTIIAGALLGESLNLSPSPQLGQYYLIPFKQKEKRDKQGNVIQPETVKASLLWFIEACMSNYPDGRLMIGGYPPTICILVKILDGELILFR